jgi:hypothetical protein
MLKTVCITPDKHGYMLICRSDVGPEPYGLAVRGGAWSRPVMSYASANSAAPTLHEQV